MTRKRARKILMSIGTSRNHANWGLTAKPRWKTNAGVVEDALAIKLYAKLHGQEWRARRMAKHITSAQLQEIMDAAERGLDEYNEVLRRIARIEAREYTSYQYFDERGEYVGDDNEMLLEDILDNAGVEVRDD
mgnify:CR=1 FL=1|jgi:hypothetical protein|nr:MAG TPA: hypothetical protein [Caudoviricetes sp.]